jgi:GNAT superfamily N-acetyltransferase
VVAMPQFHTLICHEYRHENGKAEAIAHIRVYERLGELWLTDVWVHPDEREQGRASALLRAVITDLGSRRIFLEIAPYTDAPLGGAKLAAFYSAFGFVETAVPGVLCRPASGTAVREALAAYAHEAWSGWMAYLFSTSTLNEDGTVTIPKWAVERWQRQMTTAYDQLPDSEKESDRAEADKMIAVCTPT